MKKIITKINFIVLIAAIVFPCFSHAMSIRVDRPGENIIPGDVVIMKVYLDSGEKEINSAEGKIIISGDYQIESILTDGSIFDLWPQKPTIKDNTISFTGGSTAGVFGNNLKLFSIAMKIKTTNPIKFSLSDVSIFMNDGLGTKIDVIPVEQNIVVENKDRKTRNELDVLLKKDTKNPEPFEILIDRNENVFDGKYFAVFNAVDKNSGIKKYLVNENNKVSETTDNFYILKDQKAIGKLTITAIDNAGNKQEEIINIKDGLSIKNQSINWNGIFIATFVLLLLNFIFKFIKKIIKKK